MTKQRVKRFAALLLAVLFMVCLFSASALAASKKNVYTVKVENGVLTLLKNGRRLNPTYPIDEKNEVRLLVQNGRLVLNYTDSSGTVRNLSMGNAATDEWRIQGNIPVLTLDQTLGSMRVTIDAKANVGMLNVNHKGIVDIYGKVGQCIVNGAAKLTVKRRAVVTNMKVLNSGAVITIDVGGVVKKISTVPGVLVRDKNKKKVVVTEIGEAAGVMYPAPIGGGGGGGWGGNPTVRLNSVTVVNATTVNVTSVTSGLTKSNFVFEPIVTINNVTYNAGAYTLTLAAPGLIVNTSYKLTASKAGYNSASIDKIGYSNVTLAAENFNTHKSTDYVGINVGWNIGLSDVNLIDSMKVELFDGTGKVLANNTGVMSMLKTVAGGKFSTPFFVKQGTYKAASDAYWTFGAWTPIVSKAPVKAVITITDVFGKVFTANNTSLQASAPSHPTWEDLFVEQDLVQLTAENFNTHKSTDYVGINVGWNIGASNVNLIESMKVELFDSADKVLATNHGVMSMLKTVAGRQFSTPFFVKQGTYKAASDAYWSFGAWTPKENKAPVKAVITITDVFGRKYTASNTSLQASAPSHPTWEDLFVEQNLVQLTAENFNTHKSTDYVGINVGWNIGLSDVKLIESMKVELFDSADKVLATNDGVMSMLKTVAGGQFSTPFFVKQGTYKAASDAYWAFGAWTPAEGKKPTKAVITIVDVFGKEYTAENTSLQASAPSHPTWADLFVEQDLVDLTAENFNTNKSTDYTGINVGWNIGLSDVKNIDAMKVELFDAAGNLLVTNNGVMSKLRTVSGGIFSTPFFILQGTYTALGDEYWSFGAWTPVEETIPAKAVITIKDVFGREYIVENTSLAAEAGKEWDTLFTAPEFIVTVLSSTRSNLVDTANNTINNFGWFAVKLGSLLDLSQGSKGNFVISYEFSTDHGASWQKAKKADGVEFFKDKSWTGYLNREDGTTRYPGAQYSGNVVPANVIIDSNETKVASRASDAYAQIITPGSVVMVRTVLDITDNYGNVLPSIKLNPVTFTNGVPDNRGIDIYN